MRICIAVNGSRGLKEDVSQHFGSAAGFLVVDTEKREIIQLENRNQHHSHGMCNPVEALAGQEVAAVIVGGIGQRALDRLNRAGVAVFCCGHRTVEEAIELAAKNQLSQVLPEEACSGRAGAGQAGGGTCRHR